MIQSAYTWIFATGIVVFFVVIIVLLFFTSSPIELPLSFNGDLEHVLPDSEEEINSLPEDARLSYERAKCMFFSSMIFSLILFLYSHTFRLARTSCSE